MGRRSTDPAEHERAVAARRARQKRNNIGHTDVDFSWQVFRGCELCDHTYVANNYADRKIRIKRWEGIEVCPRCRFETVVHIKELVNAGVLQFTESHIHRRANPDPKE